MESEHIEELEAVHTVDTQTTSLLNVAAMMPVARQNPRRIDRCIDAAIAIISMDKAAASECFYSLPRGNKQIVGPSIGLAETISGTWGNMVVSVDDVHIGEKEVTVRGWVCDTQHGVAVQDFIRRRITKRDGERYDDDMINVTIAAARSVLYRNLVLRVVPRPVVRKLFDAARDVALGKAGLFSDRQRKVVEFWAEKGVKKERLLNHLEITKVAEITVDHIDYLLGLNQAIELGDVDIDDVFGAGAVRPKEDKDPPVKTKPKPKAKAKDKEEKSEETQPVDYSDIPFGDDPEPTDAPNTDEELLV